MCFGIDIVSKNKNYLPWYVVYPSSVGTYLKKTALFLRVVGVQKAYLARGQTGGYAFFLTMFDCLPM